MNFTNKIISKLKNSARNVENVIQRQISGVGLSNKNVANFSKFQAAWDRYNNLMDKFMEDMAG